MKRLAWGGVVAGLLVAPTPGLAAQESIPLADLFSPGIAQAEILQEVVPPELKPLAQKLRMAVQANDEWLKTYVMTAPEGQPLPYHPNFGLTETEYNRFLALMDSTTMKAVSTVSIVVAATEAGVELRSPELPALDGMRFDFSSGVVKTSLGIIPNAEEMHMDDGGAVGARDGWHWRREEGDPLEGKEAVLEMLLSIGRLRDGGRIVLTYSVRAISAGEPIRTVEHVIRF